MPRLTKIYTRTGDDGTTGLGTGERVSKTSPRMEAIGTVDELNSAIGVVRAVITNARLGDLLEAIQNDLFHAGAELCMPLDGSAKPAGPRIEARHVARLEPWIDELNEALPALENFILPGGAPGAAQLFLARAVARRAERDVIRLRADASVGADIVPYLNRLSDLLFVMGRSQNQLSGHPEPIWDSRA